MIFFTIFGVIGFAFLVFVLLAFLFGYIQEWARVYTDLSTIEGKLEVISVHKGFSCVVWEAFTNQRIDCSMREGLFNEIKNHLGSRVAVMGKLRYRNHVPKSMQVESFERLPEASELPQPKDIGPINITDGLSSEEYVRRLRDD